MASTTLATLIQECGKKLHLYAGPTAPSAGSSVTAFTMGGASSTFDEVDESTMMEDVWAKVESDTAGTPLNVGEVRRIKSYNASTSVITLPSSRGFSNAPTTTQSIGFYFAVPPGSQWRNINGWTYYINKTLENIRYRRLGLLTLITDGDAENSGVTDWTASSATATKVTAAANVALGTQALRVANSGANGYARPALLNVAAGDTYYLRADVRVASGTGVLEAYDETNAASITTESSAYADWRTIYYNFLIPSGCKSLSIRLKGTEASADVYWDNVSLLSVGTRNLPLPSWVDSPQIDGLYEYRGDYGQGDEIATISQRLYPVPFRNIEWDQAAATPMRIHLSRHPREDSLLLVQALSRHATLTADSAGATADDASSTTADKWLVVAGACYLAMKDRGRDDLAAPLLQEFKTRSRLLPRREGYVGAETQNPGVRWWR